MRLWKGCTAATIACFHPARRVSSLQCQEIVRSGRNFGNLSSCRQLFLKPKRVISTSNSITRFSSRIATCINTSDNDSEISSSDSDYATSYHAPVMWKQCIDALLDCKRSKRRREQAGESSVSNIDNMKDGEISTNNNLGEDRLIFVDGTLGGGGHSAALLKRLQPGDIVFGCDVDPSSLSTTSKRLEKYISGNEDTLPLFVPTKSNFCDLESVIKSSVQQLLSLTTDQNQNSNHGDEDQSSSFDAEGTGIVDGILLDLGVSSHQIDEPDRGFAFMKDGPLDMRMGGSASSGLTAADICNECDQQEIQRILKVHGDESRHRALAKSIMDHRPLKTTNDLVKAVAAVTPEFAKRKRQGRTATLARVFQSLRIIVNREDIVLETALTEMSPALIRPGGRLVVLSYHSKEDRPTKRVMKNGDTSNNHRNDERDMYGNYIGKPKPYKPVGKARKASDEEVGKNSRSRSATLRIGERQ